MLKRTKDQASELRRRIRKLAAKGVIKSEIARRCGVSFATVHNVLSTPLIDRRARAAERRALWAEMAREGMSFAEMARRSGVSKTAVRLALKSAAESRLSSDETALVSEGEV